MNDWLGGAIGGLFGYKGTKDTNVASAQQAQKQMDFQREMSSTAIQRRMKDLKAGGLNPILAGSHEASTPGGAMAPVLNKAQIAMQNASTAAAINKTNAETSLIKSELPKEQTWEIVWNKLKDMAQSTGQSIDEIKKIGKEMRNHPDWNKPIWERETDNQLFGQDFYPNLFNNKTSNPYVQVKGLQSGATSDKHYKPKTHKQIWMKPHSRR